MKLFELFATLSLDDSKFTEKIKAATQSAETLSETLGGGKSGSSSSDWNMAKAVAKGQAIYDGATRMTRGLINFGKGIVSTAADVQSSVATFESVFGQMGPQAVDLFKQMGDQTGIYWTRLRDEGTHIFTQYKAAGFETSEAFNLMAESLMLIADGAAQANLSLESTGTRFRSFMRGNSEAGEYINLFNSAVLMNEKANEIYELSWDSLTEAQRQFIRLDIAKEIYDTAGITGQAAREMEQWANTIGNISAVWDNAQYKIGMPIIESLTKPLQELTEWVDENPEKFEAFGAVLADLAGILADLSKAVITFTGEHGGELVNWVSDLFGLETRSSKLNEISKFFTMQNGFGRFNQEAFNLAIMTGDEEAKVFYDEFQAYLAGKQIDMDAQIPESDLLEMYDSVKSYLQAKDFTVNIRGVVSSVTQDVRNALLLSGEYIGPPVPGKAVGMDYVPYDNYFARLHEGEAILTKAEATNWRRGEGGGSAEWSRIESLMGEIRDALAGFKSAQIVMDGQAVGNLVTDQVSRNIAQAAYAGRYGGR